MGILDAIILGAVHGLTEFFPISSSVHLLLLRELVKISPTDIVTFEVFVRLGTLGSVLVHYRTDVWELVKGTAQAGFHPLHLLRRYREDKGFADTVRILVATIPAAVFGILFQSRIAAMFDDPKLIATMLVVSGLLLFLARLFRTVPGREVGLASGLFTGFAQALAILPGISRSGATISAAMYCGVAPLRAVRFALLLSIPVIIGGALLKAGQMVWLGSLPDDLGALAVAVVVAFGAGLAAIRALSWVIVHDRLRFFAFYCLSVGFIGILFL